MTSNQLVLTAAIKAETSSTTVNTGPSGSGGVTFNRVQLVLCLLLQRQFKPATSKRKGSLDTLLGDAMPCSEPRAVSKLQHLTSIRKKKVHVGTYL